MDFFRIEEELRTIESGIISEVAQQNYEIWRQNVLLQRAIRSGGVPDSLAFAVNNRISPVLDSVFSPQHGDPFRGCYDIEGDGVLAVARALRRCQRDGETVAYEALLEMAGVGYDPDRLTDILKYISLALRLDQALLARLIARQENSTRLWDTILVDHAQGLQKVI